MIGTLEFVKKNKHLIDNNPQKAYMEGYVDALIYTGRISQKEAKIFLESKDFKEFLSE